MEAERGNKDEQRKKMVGWKMIARYLGRSERAVQLWESQRSLPVHRIPGLRGQTVYAYATELDAWIEGDGIPVASQATKAGTSGPDVIDPVMPKLEFRPPGILILPVERRNDVDARCNPDALCQQLIVRLSAMQPVRVLSWTTSRSIQQSVEPVECIAERLNVRYLVESLMESHGSGLHVDVRVVDTEFDQVVLADRFVVPDGAGSAAFAELADGVALHFALIHAGALVERICIVAMQPAHFLHYLAAAQAFFDDTDGTNGTALATVNRALRSNPDFIPSKALRALVLLHLTESQPDEVASNEARVIFAACRNEASARVTTAFLGAAIARRTGRIDKLHETLQKMTLRWVPPPSGRDGRLYERRSSLRRRDSAREAAEHGTIERRARAAGNAHPLIDSLLKTLVAAHGHGLAPSVEQFRPLAAGVQGPSTDEHAVIPYRHGHNLHC